MLSNTAVPRYYGAFRDAVLRGDIHVCKEVAMEMWRIDRLIESPGYYYDDRAVEGWIEFCENELTLTDGSDLHLLDTFKLWGEQVFGWYYFDDRSVYVPNPDGRGGRYVTKRVKQRLTKKQYLIVGRGAAKSLYDSCIQAYFCVVDGSTTHQITTAPTMKQAEEIVNPIKTAITRARGPVFQFMTEGSLQNTTGSRANRVKLASTKKGIENFISGSLVEVRPMSVDKLQGLRCKVATVDEWLSSADAREDVIGAIEQGASKLDDYLIEKYPNDPNRRVKSARIDSGDLARGSKRLRKALDAVGKPYIKLVASNGLDEKKIANMELYEHAHFDSYGVGENLITSASDPVFGGVYKLVAVKQPDGSYTPKMKCSDSASKAIIPGKKMPWRLYDENGQAQCDLIAMDGEVIEAGKPVTMVNLDSDAIERTVTFTPTAVKPLLVPHILGGQLAMELPSIAEKKAYIAKQLTEETWESELRLECPHKHYVNMTPAVAECRARMYAELHGGKV